MRDQNAPVHQLAYYEVRREGLAKTLAAIRDFVPRVRENQPGTLRYDVWQERAKPTRFVHVFKFRDAEAERAHSDAPETQEFASVLYPECLAPVVFIDYDLVASNTDQPEEVARVGSSSVF